MQVHHVENEYCKYSLANVTLDAVSLCPLKTVNSVWFEVASIFLSLVFEKNPANGKEAAKVIRCRYVWSYLSKESLVFS